MIKKLNLYKNLTYGKTVLVNLKTDKAFKGVLIEEKKDFILLKNAELIEREAEKIEIAGSLLLEKSNIDFIQILGG